MGEYAQAQGRVQKAREELKEVRKRHEHELQRAQDQLKAAAEDLAHLQAGTPPDVKLLADHVIAVYGAENMEVEDGPSVIRDAIADLLQGGTKLQHYYMGTKHYERWPGQREDHKYGYGPRHGTIVFSVGLTKEARERLLSGGELNEDEVEAAIQYLTNLRQALSVDA